MPSLTKFFSKARRHSSGLQFTYSAQLMATRIEVQRCPKSGGMAWPQRLSRQVAATSVIIQKLFKTCRFTGIKYDKRSDPMSQQKTPQPETQTCPGPFRLSQDAYSFTTLQCGWILCLRPNGHGDRPGKTR